MPKKKVVEESSLLEKEVQPKKKLVKEPAKSEPEYDNNLLEETGKILTKEARKIKRKNKENKLSYNQAIALSALTCKLTKKI